MNGNINIRLTDDTKDGRFTQTNTSEDIVNVATKPKTEVNTTGGSTPKIGQDSMGSQLMSQAGSITSKASSVASGLMTPTAIALTALSLARKAYNYWYETNEKLNAYDDLRLRAGGSNRGEVNSVNTRRNLIGGRVTGGNGSYIRR